MEFEYKAQTPLLRFVVDLLHNTNPCRLSGVSIGVSSYVALGHVPHSTSTCLIFWSLQSCTNSDIRLHVVAYPEKIYWHIVLSLFIALFSFSFVPLLAPKPGDATRCFCNGVLHIVRSAYAGWCGWGNAMEIHIQCMPHVAEADWYTPSHKL